MGGVTIPDTVNLDTVNIQYVIEGDILKFPEPYTTYSFISPVDGEMITSSAYFSDWEKISIDGKIIHFNSYPNDEKEGFVFGSGGMYLEPYD